jgi:hypothetical protein
VTGRPAAVRPITEALPCGACGRARFGHPYDPRHDGCWLCWLAKNRAAWAAKYGHPFGPVAYEVPWNPADRPLGTRSMDGGRPPDLTFDPVRRVKCRHLGDRLTHAAGCSGMTCLWECGLGHPAVPGGRCQDCPDYAKKLYRDARGVPLRLAGREGPGWLDADFGAE